MVDWVSTVFMLKMVKTALGWALYGIRAGSIFVLGLNVMKDNEHENCC